MKTTAQIAFSATFACLCSASAFAQEFSADVLNFTPDGKASKGRLYQTPDKERFDSIVELKDGNRINTRLIIDRREKLIYLVQPQQKTILINHVLQLVSGKVVTGSTSTNACEELMRMINPMIAKQEFSCTALGRESVNGRSAEKWQMESKWLGNGPSFLWVDSQVKTAIKWTLANGSSGEVQNIKVGAQPANLFELPADYRKLDLPH